jgi:hypothetical protein
VNFRKVSLEDYEVGRKYRVQTRNYYVSAAVEEFHGGASCLIMNTKTHDETFFGPSKKEYRVSNSSRINGWMSQVNGGS